MKGLMLCGLVLGAATELLAVPPATQRDPGLIVPTTQAGTLDPKTGNLIAYWMLREPGRAEGAVQFSKTPLVFSGDYGILIIGPWAEGKRPPRFYLYDNKAKTIYATTDVQAFLRRVDELPAKAKVYRLDKCTVPFDYSLSAQVRIMLGVAMDRGQRTWAGDDEARKFSPCTCETSSLLFPDGFKY